MITKVLVLKLRPMLDGLIHLSRFGFLSHKKATKNVILINEVFHSFRKKSDRDQVPKGLITWSRACGL